jgi:hypothetical protein
MGAMARWSVRTGTMAAILFVGFGLCISDRSAVARGDRLGAEESLERERVSDHLARVETWLRQREVSSPLWRSDARARNLDRLREYRLRGEFPRNTEFPGRRVPYFADAEGRLCAVGYLVAASGRGDLVEAVVRSDNHVDLRSDPAPALDRWIEGSGLDRAECAMIQPAYGYGYRKGTLLPFATGAALSATVGNTILTLNGRQSTAAGVAGILIGISTAAIATANTNDWWYGGPDVTLAYTLAGTAITSSFWTLCFAEPKTGVRDDPKAASTSLSFAPDGRGGAPAFVSARF